MRKKILLAALVTLIVIPVTVLALLKKPASAPGSTNNSATQTVEQNTTTDTKPSFNKQKYSLSDPKSPWVVVNKSRPLNPLTYAPADLTTVGSQQLRKEAADALSRMIAAAKAEGLTITPMSGYRSYSRQETVYKNEVAAYGQAKADSQSAKPGYSEHQTGWAIDVGGGGCGIEDCFGNTPNGKWVAANSYKHGFIVRYQTGKEAITGYRAEPWHIRYIGTELAAEIHNQNIQTLEEFFNL